MLYATALLPYRPEQTPDEVTRAIELDPNDAGRLTRAASLMFNLGETARARDYAEHAIEVAPPGFELVPELMNISGRITALRGDDDLAEEALRAAVSAEPDRETFVRDLASFLVDRGRIDEALTALDEALPRVRHPEALHPIRDRITARP